MQAWRRDGIDLPILVIRYNPHEYTIEEDGVTRSVKISTKEEKERRIEKVLTEIESRIQLEERILMEQEDRTENQMDLADKSPFEIEHRYYDAIIDQNGEEIAKVTLEPTYKQILSDLQNNGRKRKRQDAETPAEPR